MNPILTAVTGIWLTSSVCLAQSAQPSAPQLWVGAIEVSPSSVRADSVERRVLALDMGDLLWATGSRQDKQLDLLLFDGEVMHLNLQFVHSARPGGSTWAGTPIGTGYGESDSFYLAIQDGAVAASLRVGTDLFRVRPLATGGHIFAAIDESGFPTCGTELDPAKGHVAGGPPGETTELGGGGQMKGTQATYFDVIVAYTAAVRASSGGTSGALALVDLAVAETNSAYGKASVAPTLRLAHVYETPYVEGGDMSADLNRFQSKTDGFADEVHALRTQYGADSAALIVNSGGYCGIAYMMYSVTDSFKSSAFSVTARSCATGYYSFGHELGHNFGCAHDTSSQSSSSKPYGFGYRTPDNNYRTVMAYSPGSRVPVFSSPLATWNGYVMGTVSKEDNGRTLNENGSVISGWYPSSAPSIGTFSSVTGPQAGGNNVVVSVSGYVAGLVRVHLGGTALDALVVDTGVGQSVTMTMPASHFSGPSDVRFVQSGLDLTAPAAYTFVAPQLVALSPNKAAWYESPAILIAGHDFAPNKPATIEFGTTPPLIVLASVASDATMVAWLPAEALAVAGLVDVKVVQDGISASLPSGWSVLPSLDGTLSGDSASGGQLELTVEAASAGTVLMFHASTTSPLPLTFLGFHHEFILDLGTATNDGAAALGSGPTFAWNFGPGQVPAGVQVVYQGLAVESTSLGLKYSFTNTADVTVP